MTSRWSDLRVEDIYQGNLVVCISGPLIAERTGTLPQLRKGKIYIIDDIDVELPAKYYHHDEGNKELVGWITVKDVLTLQDIAGGAFFRIWRFGKVQD